MSYAQGSRTRLSLKAQPDYPTQATGNFVEVPYATFTLNPQRQNKESATSRSDREVTDSRLMGWSVGGTIEAELRYGDAALELLMQSAMFNVWASSEMGIGTQRTFLSIEDSMLDIGQHRMFRGCEVSRMTITAQPNEYVRIACDIVGRDMTVSGSSGAGTVAAPSANLPMDSFTGSIYDQFPASGSELNIVTSFELVVDNGIQPVYVIGDNKPAFQEAGRGRVTGNMSMFVRDATAITRFVNDTEAPVLFQTVDPAGNDYVFYVGRGKYTGNDLPEQSEQSRVLAVPFMGLRPTSGVTTALRIQK